MKFYKINKSALTWKEMPQTNFTWNLPILIDDKYNVIAGNSLKDCLPDSIYVVVMTSNETEPLVEAIEEIERKVIEENDFVRMNSLKTSFTEFFKAVRKPQYTYDPLFDLKETRCVTEDNYIEPPPYNFDKHGQQKGMYNEGEFLMEEFEEILYGKKTVEELPFDIDEEILKEIM